MEKPVEMIGKCGRVVIPANKVASMKAKGYVVADESPAKSKADEAIEAIEAQKTKNGIREVVEALGVKVEFEDGMKLADMKATAVVAIENDIWSRV